MDQAFKQKALKQSPFQILLNPLWALNKSAQTWFVVALLGQLLFVIYIITYFWLNMFVGNFAAWDGDLPNGFIQGNALGNAALLTHLFLAAIVTFSGPLQLIPKIRSLAPRFHHWNGRVYLFTALVISVSGLYIVWTADKVAGGVIQQYAISINATLIIIFSILTLKYAIARKLVIHRRWALRLFMVVSGVWFFRVGLWFWLVVNQAPVGIDTETFTGPFLTVLGFANYLIPLAILELYFRAQGSTNTRFQWSVSALILIAILTMLIGIGAAAMGMWLPRMY